MCVRTFVYVNNTCMYACRNAQKTRSVAYVRTWSYATVLQVILTMNINTTIFVDTAYKPLCCSTYIHTYIHIYDAIAKTLKQNANLCKLLSCAVPKHICSLSQPDAWKSAPPDAECTTAKLQMVCLCTYIVSLVPMKKPNEASHKAANVGCATDRITAGHVAFESRSHATSPPPGSCACSANTVCVLKAEPARGGDLRA